MVDLLSPRFVDRIGYKTSIIIAHVFAALGLAGLGIFPDLLPDPYVGMLAAIFFYAIGGGLIEVRDKPYRRGLPL